MPSSVLPPIVDTDVPSWKSPNELIHERINFDDTIWGFGLAGGAYYQTPLRITYVLPGSRAEKAHIYPGDVVLKINGIDSSKLTLDQAHEMILESGIHLKINVTSPEDLEDNYFCYQDPLEEQLAEELKEKEAKRKASLKVPKVSGKSSHWSLQWPWKCKRKIIYKESNCYLVPSKYEEKHKDTRKPEVKQDDMIILDNVRNVKAKKSESTENENKKQVEDIEKNSANTTNDKINIKNDDTIKQQQESVNQNDEAVGKELNSSLTNIAENSIIEQNVSPDKTNIEESTEQINSIDKSNKNDAIEQNSSADIYDQDVVVEQSDSVEHNNDDVIAEHNNDSANKTDGEVVTEENSSVDNANSNENSNLEISNSVDTNDKVVIAEQNSSIDTIKKQDSIEGSDLIDNRTNEDGVKFENGDIPGISESEKISHSSR